MAIDVNLRAADTNQTRHNDSFSHDDLSNYCQTLFGASTASTGTDVRTSCQDLLQRLFRGGAASTAPDGLHFCDHNPLNDLPQERQDLARNTFHVESANVDNNGRLRITLDQARTVQLGDQVNLAGLPESVANQIASIGLAQEVTGNVSVSDNSVSITGLSGVSCGPGGVMGISGLTFRRVPNDDGSARYTLTIRAGIGIHANLPAFDVDEASYNQVRQALRPH